MHIGSLYLIIIVLIAVGAVMIFLNAKDYYKSNSRKKKFSGDDTNPSIGILP
jgi:hypothetical protein